MSTHEPIAIVSAARTPLGGFQGSLSAKAGPELGAVAVAQAVANAGLAPTDVDEAFMGCVLSAGAKQAPGRQAIRLAGLDDQTPCTTINKVCGSGLKTVMLAHDALALGRGKVMIAGGMESMTNAPYILPKAREGMRMGHGGVLDHIFLDGLEDAYEGKLMGVYAEETSKHYQFTREAQDAFAIESLRRAKQASEDGLFADEIAPVTIKNRKGTTVVSQDEQPFKADPSKIPNLRPAFAPKGTVTAANSSSISDGAAALVLMPLSEAERRGLAPLALIRGQAGHAHEPRWFTTAPVTAMNNLLDQVGWSTSDVDLYEINEAFACVTMAAMHDMNLPHEKVNVHGGACALGHPIGASGARILVTLLNAMKQRDVSKGVASLCIGGGEAVAVAVERVN